MLRWIVWLLVVLFVFESLRPWLARIGISRLPGDLNFRLFGRAWSIPFGTAVLLSLIGWTVARLI